MRREDCCLESSEILPVLRSGQIGKGQFGIEEIWRGNGPAAAQELYIDLLAQYENLMQKIRKYVIRGAIDPERVPRIEKITLRTALAEHRKKLREQEEKQ